MPFSPWNNKTYKDIAIFYRVHALSRLLEDNFRRESIPYKIIGGVRFYDRKEVIKFFNDWNRSAIADEMVNVSFSRDFYNEDQKDLIKIINMNRDHENFCIACIPHFKNLDTQIKRLTSMRKEIPQSR